MITKQKNNGSLAEFARTLEERSKDCNFQQLQPNNTVTK